MVCFGFVKGIHNMINYIMPLEEREEEKKTQHEKAILPHWFELMSSQYK